MLTRNAVPCRLRIPHLSPLKSMSQSHSIIKCEVSILCQSKVGHKRQQLDLFLLTRREDGYYEQPIRLLHQRGYHVSIDLTLTENRTCCFGAAQHLVMLPTFDWCSALTTAPRHFAKFPDPLHDGKNPRMQDDGTTLWHFGFRKAVLRQELASSRATSSHKRAAHLVFRSPPVDARWQSAHAYVKLRR